MQWVKQWILPVHSRHSGSNSAFFFCTCLTVTEWRWRWRWRWWWGANQSSKSIYKCTDAGRLAHGHSVEVLFDVDVVSTSISHLSTRWRQRRRDMFSVTFSYCRARTEGWRRRAIWVICQCFAFTSAFHTLYSKHTWLFTLQRSLTGARFTSPWKSGLFSIFSIFSTLHFSASAG